MSTYQKKPYTAELQLQGLAASRTDRTPSKSAAGRAPAGRGSNGGSTTRDEDVTNADVLNAVRALHALIEGGSVGTPRIEADAHPDPTADQIRSDYNRHMDEVTVLKNEMRALSRCIQQTKMEIAALRHPSAEEDRILMVTNELDQIVSSTENATHNILNHAEKIDTLTETIRINSTDDSTNQAADEISEAVIRIFESCNFQDLTGQRITKVVNTLKYIEERVNAMIDIWGRDDFASLPLPADTRKDDEANLMNGPATGGSGISQDEIDKLFS